MICKPFVYRPATARTEITYDNCEIPLSRPTSSSNYLELRFRCWTSLTLTFFYSTFTYVFFNYCHVLYVFKNIFERFFSCMIHRALRSGRAPAAWTELSSRVNARRTELASHCARSHRYLARSSSAGLHGTSCHRRLVTPWHILSLVTGDSMAHSVAGDWLLLGYRVMRRARSPVRSVVLALLPQQPDQPVLLRARQRAVQEGVPAYSAPRLATRMTDSNTSIDSVQRALGSTILGEDGEM